MGVGVTLSNAVLEFALRGDIATYVSLHTAEPQPDAGPPELYEVEGVNYAREFLAPEDWSAAVSGTSETVVPVTFAAAGDSWGTITHVGICDAATGGNLLWWGEIAVPRNITSGDTMSFPAGNLTGQVSG